jgi:hypothetical protein
VTTVDVDSENDKPATRSNIPLPVQRAVRQRCGFGCVICGLPLYEYEHMLGWANVWRHVADEITLLCDQHHREKTSGLLPIDEMQRANSEPFNMRSGVSKPYDLHYSGTACEAVIGGNSFTISDAGYGTSMAPVVIDGTPLLGFVLGDGHLLLHLNLFDDCNKLVLRIANNQLVYSTSPWDIRLVGRRLAIREAAGQFLIEITFEVPNRIVITRGRFMLNGVELVVRPEYALITNNRMLMSGGSAINCSGGLVIGPMDNESGAMIRVDGVRRYSAEASERAIAWAEERMAETGRGGQPGTTP